jgi:hypothetical protein
MRAAIERHTPDMAYIVVPLILAISAAIINFLGSPETRLCRSLCWRIQLRTGQSH